MRSAAPLWFEKFSWIRFFAALVAHANQNFREFRPRLNARLCKTTLSSPTAEAPSPRPFPLPLRPESPSPYLRTPGKPSEPLQDSPPQSETLPGPACSSCTPLRTPTYRTDPAV